tara:strand:+ start:656 stop:784 length:129 start_codon:yes stop_codon:yes gene_type:complete
MIKKILILTAMVILSSCAYINETDTMKKYKEGQKKKTMADWK